jgi:hypothetical protein
MLIWLKHVLENEADGGDTGTAGGGAVQQSGDANAHQGGAAAESSSTADTGNAGAASGDKAGEANAGGAAAKDDKPKSALDAVLRVMKKPDAAAAGAENKDAAKPGAAGEQAVDESEHKAAGEGEKDWISKEEYGKLPPVVRRRIGRLTTERNEARDQIKAVQPKARTLDELTEYCKVNRMSQEDFSYGLSIMALVRTDPAKAWEALQPLVRDLQAHVGEILPGDLQKEVEQGTITEVRAKELARARRESQLATQRHATDTEERRRADAERTWQDNHEKTTGSIKDWEGRWAASDPDYKLLAERVFERMVVLMRGREHEMNPKLAVEIAEQAKKDVKGWATGLRPVKQEKQPPVPPTQGGGAVGKPKSALEAARMAVKATAVAG